MDAEFVYLRINGRTGEDVLPHPICGRNHNLSGLFAGVHADNEALAAASAFIHDGGIPCLGMEKANVH